MEKRRLVCLCFLLLQPSGIAKPARYVSPDGSDDIDCGETPDKPCRQLSKALSLSSHGESIYIDSGESHDYWLCDEDPLLVTRSVTISGYGGRARIGCPQDGLRLLMFNISSSIYDEDMNTADRAKSGVIFRDLNFSSVLFHAHNTHVTFVRSALTDGKWLSSETSDYIGLHINESEWRSSSESNATSPQLGIASGMLHMRVINSAFYNTKIKVTAMFGINLHVTDTIFSNDPRLPTVHGGLYVAIKSGEQNSVVEVIDSVFEHQMHDDPVQSIMNLFEAALLVRAANRYPTAPLSNVTVLVERVKFLNNERGLTFLGALKRTDTKNCLFVNNTAMHAAAAILFLTDVHTVSTVSNCTFTSNAAGSFSTEKLLRFKDTFQVSGDEVKIEATCCKGVISFVGKGGAIRVQRGSIDLLGCRFINNTARLLGGAIFIDRDGFMRAKDTYFSNTAISYHSRSGDILYSNGKLAMHNAELRVLTAQNHVAVLRHSGDHWSIDVGDVSVQCPVGFRLRVTNTSAYRVDLQGLQRSYQLDQLSYFCESCPQNKYSLDHGFMNSRLVYSANAYFTLLINGQVPTAAYNGSYEYHDITCLPCPYGGKCNQQVTAVPNFWGYIHANRLRFQRCPKSYCCSSVACSSYSQCAAHRTGRLCGKCEEGYSEALFSAQCVPNSKCDASWLWPLVVASGILYALFLLYQKDIRDLLFMRTIRVKDVQFPCCNRHDYTQEEYRLRAPLNSEQDNHILSGAETETEKHTNIDCVTSPVKSQPQVDTGAGFMIILFYYFQDAQLLHLKTASTSDDNKSKAMLKEILSGLFKFRIELFQFLDKLCFLEGVSPSMKLLIQVLLVPYVLLQFAIMYFVYRSFVKNVRGKKNSANDNTVIQKKTFLSKLATGFVLSLLFTYQKLATASFTLLNCVPVGNESVLFIEGTVTCYRVWQYVLIAYVSCCIVPFCLVLLIGPGLLKDGLISLKHFFCACLLPLPFLLYWVTLRLRLRGWRPEVQCVLSAESMSVLQILQGPFKDSVNKHFGPTCGAGLLIGRRLILIVLFTFVNNTLVRMLCMLFFCFIILVHHVHALPYKDVRGNMAGSASAAALLIVGGINLVRAGFEAAEYVAQGPNKVLLGVLEEVENVLMLWFPAAVMGVAILALHVKLCLMALNAMFRRKAAKSDDGNETDTRNTA